MHGCRVDDVVDALEVVALGPRSELDHAMSVLGGV